MIDTIKINPKSEERAQRYKQNYHKYEISDNRSLSEWSKLFSRDANKNAFILFLCQYIEINFKMPHSQENKKLFLAGGYSDRLTTKVISNLGTYDSEHLFSNHTEADSRIIAHCTTLAVNF